MSDEINLAELFEESDELGPLKELIQTILDLKDEELTDESIKYTIASISNSLTPKIKQLAIDGLLKMFAENNLTYETATVWMNEAKDAIKTYINTLNCSNAKKTIIDSILNVFFELFDISLDQYAGYSFTLPIKVEAGGVLPKYAHDTDAAADIYAAETYELAPHSLSNKIKTNLKIALPEGWAAAILPRSSIGAKTGLRLSNSVGIIDSDYRGEIGVLYDNISDSAYTINAGDRIAQMVIFPVHHFKPLSVDSLEETERGEGGFGSTGT